MKSKKPLSLSSIISIIFTSTPLKRLKISLINLLGVIVSLGLIYFAVWFYFLNPWANLVLLSQIISIVLTLIFSIIQVCFVIHQLVVLFANFKEFSDSVKYAILTLIVCLLTFASTCVGVCFVLKLL